MRALGYFLIFTAIAGTALAGPAPVPEVDPGTAGGAIALLLGGYLVAIGKFRK